APAEQAAGWTGRRPAARPSARFPDGTSTARPEPPGRAHSRPAEPSPCRCPETDSICGPPSQAAAPLRSPDLPHGQASAIAAQRASLTIEFPFSSPSYRQKKSARRNGAESLARLLTVIRGSAILGLLRTEKGFRNSF